MSQLLTADLHLDDRPENEYRWNVFSALRDARPKHYYILGDLVDRADRHSGALVNRLLDELRSLRSPVTVLRGNHDTPLSGPAYFEFMSQIPDLCYVSRPREDGDLLLLPSSADPASEWHDIDFRRYRSVFMHQMVFGCTLRPGLTAEAGLDTAIFPATLRVYSGDIHTPHRVGPVTYVGAPHWVRFGDEHDCRLLLLDDDYRATGGIALDPPRKHIFDITTPDELARLSVRAGDQVIMRCALAPDAAASWPALRDAIHQWAEARHVRLVSSEPSTTLTRRADQGGPLAASEPASVLRAFATSEGLDAATLETGLRLLQEQLA